MEWLVYVILIMHQSDPHDGAKSVPLIIIEKCNHYLHRESLHMSCHVRVVQEQHEGI